MFAVSVLSLTLGNNQKNIDPNSLTGEYNNSDENGVFLGDEVASSEVVEKNQKTNVLGEYTGNKRIEVDLTNQKVYAF